MKSICWQHASFVAMSPTVELLPRLRTGRGRDIPEIALLGRSNVGKSSLLNYLFGVKGLAKTSSTPGKTQGLTLFRVDEALAVVDLPGYGYAKVPESIRKQWSPMVRGYLQERSALKVILWLFDIRRSPEEQDHQLLEWLAQSGKAIILVLTKADQVKKSEVALCHSRILETLRTPDLVVVPVSAHGRHGRDRLVATILDAVNSEMDDELDEERE